MFKPQTEQGNWQNWQARSRASRTLTKLTVQKT